MPTFLLPTGQGLGDWLSALHIQLATSEPWLASLAAACDTAPLAASKQLIVLQGRWVGAGGVMAQFPGD